MPTLAYNEHAVLDFDELVAQPFDLKSPFRSTVPLLSYWSAPRERLSEIAQIIGTSIPEDATLTFEYTVSPRRGRGKASHTDLMISSSSVAVACEAKYTEPDYDVVAAWLGTPPSRNRTTVLESWLDVIRSAVGVDLSIEQVSDITYQLIHRTASVCSVQAGKRAVIYHCFDLTNGHCYGDHLRKLSRLIAAPEKLTFCLFTTALVKSQAYLEMQQHWQAKVSRDFSVPLRKLLMERSLVTSFGQPVSTRF